MLMTKGKNKLIVFVQPENIFFLLFYLFFSFFSFFFFLINISESRTHIMSTTRAKYETDISPISKIMIRRGHLVRNV